MEYTVYVTVEKSDEEKKKSNNRSKNLTFRTSNLF